MYVCMYVHVGWCYGVRMCVCVGVWVVGEKGGGVVGGYHIHVHLHIFNSLLPNQFNTVRSKYTPQTEANHIMRKHITGMSRIATDFPE